MFAAWIFILSGASASEPGTDVVKATVVFWNGDERVSKETTIQVTEDPACEADDDDSGAGEDRTVVTVPGRQDVVKGTQGTVYPIILENNGNTDRTYEVSASGLDTWATYRFDPGTLTLVKAGEAETVYLYVTPKDDAAAGEKVFMVTVETDGDRKQIALNANVVEGDGGETPGDFGDLSNFLEIAVVVLIVLVVVLALVVAFSRMKGDEENGDEGSQTYY